MRGAAWFSVHGERVSIFWPALPRSVLIDSCGLSWRHSRSRCSMWTGPNSLHHSPLQWFRISAKGFSEPCTGWPSSRIEPQALLTARATARIRFLVSKKEDSLRVHVSWDAVDWLLSNLWYVCVCSQLWRCLCFSVHGVLIPILFCCCAVCMIDCSDNGLFKVVCSSSSSVRCISLCCMC